MQTDHYATKPQIHLKIMSSSAKERQEKVNSEIISASRNAVINFNEVTFSSKDYYVAYVFSYL